MSHGLAEAHGHVFLQITDKLYTAKSVVCLCKAAVLDPLRSQQLSLTRMMHKCGRAFVWFSRLALYQYMTLNQRALKAVVQADTLAAHNLDSSTSLRTLVHRPVSVPLHAVLLML